MNSLKCFEDVVPVVLGLFFEYGKNHTQPGYFHALRSPGSAPPAINGNAITFNPFSNLERFKKVKVFFVLKRITVVGKFR
jgi:hypothetical protein